jgi:hypothetical protein
MKTIPNIFQRACGSAARRPLIRPVLLAAFFAAGVTGASRAEPAGPSEYALKAVNIYKFLKFTDWPETAFASSNAPIRIGVLGDDAFGAMVEKVMANESIHDRPVVVRPAKKIEEMTDCHVIFVGKSEKPQTGHIVSVCENLPVLILGESDGFAEAGGIVNFYLQDKSVRFEVNLEAMRKHSLKIDSSLLDIGKIVKTRPGQPEKK